MEEVNYMSNKNIIMVIIFVFLIGVVYFGSQMLNQSSFNTSPSTDSQNSNQQLPIGGGPGNADNQQVRTFDVEGKPFEFTPKEIKVKKGDMVVINFTNTEGFHDWVIDEFNARTKQIPAGQTETIQFVADKTGTFEYYCSVPTHRQKGMVGKLIVE